MYTICRKSFLNYQQEINYEQQSGRLQKRTF